jgi:hypothetical protein
MIAAPCSSSQARTAELRTAGSRAACERCWRLTEGEEDSDDEDDEDTEDVEFREVGDGSGDGGRTGSGQVLGSEADRPLPGSDAEEEEEEEEEDMAAPTREARWSGRGASTRGLSTRLTAGRGAAGTTQRSQQEAGKRCALLSVACLAV